MNAEQLQKGTELKLRTDAIVHELQRIGYMYEQQRITIQFADPVVFITLSDMEVTKGILDVVISSKREELSRLRKEFEEL